MPFVMNLNKKFSDLESAMDLLIDGEPLVYKNDNMQQRLGRFCNELRDRKILHLSYDRVTNESIAYLKINNRKKPNSVKKETNNIRIKYVFNDCLGSNTLIPRFKW